VSDINSIETFAGVEDGFATATPLRIDDGAVEASAYSRKAVDGRNAMTLASETVNPPLLKEKMTNPDGAA
jgi:hypothetical protein